jgi:hypothetical protein
LKHSIPRTGYCDFLFRSSPEIGSNVGKYIKFKHVLHISWDCHTNAAKQFAMSLMNTLHAFQINAITTKVHETAQIDDLEEKPKATTSNKDIELSVAKYFPALVRLRIEELIPSSMPHADEDSARKRRRPPRTVRTNRKPEPSVQDAVSFHDIVIESSMRSLEPVANTKGTNPTTPPSASVDDFIDSILGDEDFHASCVDTFDDIFDEFSL